MWISVLRLAGDLLEVGGILLSSGALVIPAGGPLPVRCSMNMVRSVLVAPLVITPQLLLSQLVVLLLLLLLSAADESPGVARMVGPGKGEDAADETGPDTR